MQGQTKGFSKKKKVSHNLKKKIRNHSTVNQLPKLSITLLKYLKQKVAYFISDKNLAAGYVNKVEYIL